MYIDEGTINLFKNKNKNMQQLQVRVVHKFIAYCALMQTELRKNNSLDCERLEFTTTWL
jgi:hypothetical protein